MGMMAHDMRDEMRPAKEKRSKGWLWALFLIAVMTVFALDMGSAFGL